MARRPIFVASLSLFVGSGAVAQAPGDLTDRFGGFQAGPFVACDIGYEWYVGLRQDGTLGSFGSPPAMPMPAGTFVAADVAVGQLAWAMLLRADGSAVYWGPNQPAGVQNVPPGPFTAVSAGSWHCLGLRPDGTVVQWGSPDAGEPPAGPWAAVSAGYNYSVGLRPGGTLEAWGTNSAHGLLSPPPGQFRAVAAGSSHAVAITTSGTLVAWGNPAAGHLAVPAGEFVEVSVGDYSIARRSDGTVAAWGNGWPPALPGVYSHAAAGLVYAIGIVGCYANCDGSTTGPTLNVADFTCFLQKFAAADPLANCDGSTTVPTLNVADFTCFLQKFAAGCP